MCVICISDKGIKQPTKMRMLEMWNRNPHGAGYMYARSNYVYIRKGFMTFNDFYQAVKSEHFTDEDVVVYHFRISTQGGINPEMTHPFMFTNDIHKTKVLRKRTNIGICHNGIIPATSKNDREYSDTAHFVAEYLPRMIRKPRDLMDESVKQRIYGIVQSRMVFLDYAGNITKVGSFYEDRNGLQYSNLFFTSWGSNEQFFRCAG